MTATAEPRGRLRETLAGWEARARAVHPVRLLRWLRAGVIAMVVTTALLFLLVSAQATEQVGTARRTQRTVVDLGKAHKTAVDAATALQTAIDTGQVPLIGAGTEFANDTARVNNLITSAAEGNAAGKRGLARFQFVQGQLTTGEQQVNTAVGDYARRGDEGMEAARQALIAQRAKDPEGKVIPGTGGLTESLLDLRTMQDDALAAQRDSHWLSPAYVWSLLVGPAAVMCLCVLATGYVVARHFRRYADGRLVAALLTTAAVGITTSLLCRHDAQTLGPDPLIGHWLTRTLALCLLAAAGVVAHLGYRPRLAEYRFPRS